MKLLLDTNILVDLVACREPFVQAARTLCIASAFGDVQLWTSTQSFADAFYILRKGATKTEVKQALLATLEFLIPCGTYAEDLKNAFESNELDVEDYLIMASAKRIKADYFITRDADLAKKSSTKAIRPEDAVQLLADKGLTYDTISLP